MKSLFLLICLLFLEELTPLTLADDPVQEFTFGNNLFAAAAYQQTSRLQKGNFLLSPFSAESILALIQSGAKGPTEEELRTGLHLPPQQRTTEALRALTTSLSKDDQYNLQSANKVYVNKGFKINDSFRKNAISNFGSEVENVDFLDNVGTARTINQWVERRTNNKIRNLVQSQNLNDRTRSVLVNALYFRANWSNPFEKFQTRGEKFFKSRDEAIEVLTMHDTDYNSYFESEELKARFLELPFRGGEVTLTLVLPNEVDGVRILEAQLERVVQRPKYSLEYVRVALPRFRVESEIDLKTILPQLGVRKIFRGEEADLSGIAGRKGDLLVDEILQKTFLELDEKGVEAAAASYAVVGVPLSGFVNTVTPKDFKVDRPFVFYIKYKDLVLFVGRVVDPSR